MDEISLVFGGIQTAAIVGGIVLAIMELKHMREQRKTELQTRQAQLFMQIFDSFYSSGYRKSLMELSSDSWTWTDFDDFMHRFGPDADLEAYQKFRFLFAQIDRLGMLVNWELIDTDRLRRWGGEAFVQLWEKFEPIVVEYRSRFRAREGTTGMLYEDYEDFYYRLKELQEKTREDYIQRIIPMRIEKRKDLGLKPITYPQ